MKKIYIKIAIILVLIALMFVPSKEENKEVENSKIKIVDNVEIELYEFIYDPNTNESSLTTKLTNVGKSNKTINGVTLNIMDKNNKVAYSIVKKVYIETKPNKTYELIFRHSDNIFLVDNYTIDYVIE